MHADDIRTLAVAFPSAMITVRRRRQRSGGDPIFYTLGGPENMIDAAAPKLADYIRSIPGTVNVQTGAESRRRPPEHQCRRPESAPSWRLNPGDVATAARIAIGGAVATQRAHVDRARRRSRAAARRVPQPARRRSQHPRARQRRLSIYRLGDVCDVHAMIMRRPRSSGSTSSASSRVTGGIDPGATTLGAVTQKIDAGDQVARLLSARRRAPHARRLAILRRDVAAAWRSRC